MEIQVRQYRKIFSMGVLLIVDPRNVFKNTRARGRGYSRDCTRGQRVPERIFRLVAVSMLSQSRGTISDCCYSFRMLKYPIMYAVLLLNLSHAVQMGLNCY